MEVMQQLRMEVGGKAKAAKEAMQNLKEDLEEVVEEALLKRRGRTDRTVSDGSSTLTTVSSTASETSTTTTSSSSSGEDVLDTAVVVHEAAAGESTDEKHKDSVYFDKIEGTETEIKVDDFDIQQVMGAIIDAKQVESTPKDKTSAGPSKKQAKTEATYELEESDEEVVELEFETAVETMHTHDGYNMFCPNCSSRITKVVLRRKIRRRRVPAERRDLFGCASCFSIFVSCGNRLNPFRIFRADRDNEDNIQLPQEQMPSDVPVPTSDHPAQASDTGCDPFWLFRKGKDDADDLKSPLLAGTESETISSSTKVTQTTRDEAIDQGKRFDLFRPFRKGRDNKNAFTSTVLVTTEEIQSTSTTITQKPGDDGGISQQDKDVDSTETVVGHTVTTTTAAVGQHIFGKIERKIGAAAASVVSIGNILQTPSPQTSAETGNVIINFDKQNREVIIPFVEAPVPSGNILQTPPPQGSAETGNIIISINDKQNREVIIPFVEAPIASGTPQPTIIASTVAQPLIVSEPGSSRSVEIVKSVVYGGLMESIASLSVVSSAAASDATTLNIVVLGLANLVGGLVVLAHNLKDLRYGENGQTNEQKYKEELGRKEHFPLHATVAILSYIIFGLIPPVTYGFTFRETNDRDSKMLALAAASLLCISILAIGKAYTRGEHKFMAYFKTVSYYITSAVAASGIAFAVGDLSRKFVEKYGWLDPATVHPEPSSFQSTTRTWVSY